MGVRGTLTVPALAVPAGVPAGFVATGPRRPAPAGDGLLDASALLPLVLAAWPLVAPADASVRAGAPLPTAPAFVETLPYLLVSLTGDEATSPFPVADFVCAWLDALGPTPGFPTPP